MSTSRIAVVVCLLVAAHVTAAGLPHVHSEEGVRIGDLHLGRSGATGDGSSVVPPLAVEAASTCLVCAVHAPQLAPPSDGIGAVVVPATRRMADVRLVRSDPPRTWAVRARSPPPSV